MRGSCSRESSCSTTLICTKSCSCDTCSASSVSGRGSVRGETGPIETKEVAAGLAADLVESVRSITVPAIQQVGNVIKVVTNTAAGLRDSTATSAPHRPRLLSVSLFDDAVATGGVAR